MRTEITLALLMSAQTAQASMDYFRSKIDYWNSAQNVKPSEAAPTSSKPPPSEFPWKTYLDPKNKEFFKEGDYTPPEPFMELARSPTDENIRSWFEFMQKKNELAKRLDQRMAEYMTKNGTAEKSQAEVPHFEKKQTDIASITAVPIDPKRFRFRMYFDSKCPHCHDMFGVLAKLKADGFAVEGLQIDRDSVPSDERIVPISMASPEELKSRGAQGVPYLLIADTKRQGLLPAVEGYHDYGEIMKLLSAASQ